MTSNIVYAFANTDPSDKKNILLDRINQEYKDHAAHYVAELQADFDSSNKKGGYSPSGEYVTRTGRTLSDEEAREIVDRGFAHARNNVGEYDDQKSINEWIEGFIHVAYGEYAQQTLDFFKDMEPEDTGENEDLRAKAGALLENAISQLTKQGHSPKAAVQALAQSLKDANAQSNVEHVMQLDGPLKTACTEMLFDVLLPKAI